MDLATRDLAEMAPHRTVAAADTAAVSETIRAANEAAEAIVLWSGGTRIEVGEFPSRYDVALDLRPLAGVLEHSPADMVCTVRAGTTLATLASALAGAGQRWPVEVPEPRSATVGGTIASAAAGPSRLRYQHPRDWIIGCEAVLGDGTITRAGGHVVKNVTGYDLTRLYSGTFGTLAALTEVTLKLVAAPEQVRTAVLDGSPEELWRAAGALLAAHVPVDALALVREDDGRARLHARLAGSRAAVDRLWSGLRAVARFDERADDDWPRIASLPSRSERVVRLSTRPGREEEHLGREDGPFLVYPGTGVAFLFTPLDADGIRTLRAGIEASGGAAIVERAPASLRRAVGTWGASRIAPAVARALKERFDPRAVLAPGRLPV